MMMASSHPRQQLDRFLGAGLLVTGLIWLAAQAWDIWPLSFAWTLYAIGPGLVCLAAVPALGPRAAWLAALGAALMAAGLLLGALGLTNGWAAWPAAAALSGVAAPGLGWWRAGQQFSRSDVMQQGRWLTRAGAGLTALVALAVIAIGVLGGAGTAALAGAGPLLLAGAGGTLLLRR
ncbi:MAG: hypothetical protein IT340_13715 [Chloroflexi bacterium]|nr:hypothetical protein [Chloroflexota bacterium]